MRKHLPVLALIVVAAAMAAPAVAAEAPFCGQRASAGGPDLAGAPPPFFTGGLRDPSPAGDCSADCWDGSTVSCSGTSCSAHDSACPGVRGECWGSSTGTRYCPVCPNSQCNAYAVCSGSGPVTCTGSSPQSCQELDYCWVICDWNYTFCPNPDPNCPW